ncbi:MAG: adenosylcobinamide-GDP ribazoletransferase, partial [Candidatus Binatia bacterium]
MKSAVFALKFLTCWRRFDRVEADPQQMGAAIAYFPLVGVLLGFVLVLLNRLLNPHLESEILGALLIAVLALLTGANHFEGLQKTCDALSTRVNLGSEKGYGGAWGILAIVFVVLLKVRAIEVTGETRSLGLLATPMLARWSLLIFLYGSASFAEGTPRIIATNVRAWHLALTSIVTIALAAVLVAQTALWIGLALSLFALLGRSYLRWRTGSIRSDSCGAV